MCLNEGINVILELSWQENPANTYVRYTKHWTAVSTLSGLISSAHRNFQHWRSNQQPQYAEAETLPLGHQFISRIRDAEIHIYILSFPHTLTHTHTHTHTHIDIYIYMIYVCISCRAASTDIPDSLSPFLPIVHCFTQVLRSTSCILTELLYVGSSWSSCFCSTIWGGP